jgi:hypothetical protein
VTNRRSVPKAIAAVAATGLLWSLTATSHAFTDGPATGRAGLDAARAARDVLQDQRFWWKRIEPRTVSLSWFESILAVVWDLFQPMLRFLWRIVELIAKFLAKLSGVFTGSYSGGASAVWLIVGVLLAWSIWKIGVAIARWSSVGRPTRIMQSDAPCQTLAEATDLFAEASEAFRDGMHAEAIRLSLLALIARLEKHGLLRYDTTRTNREYQRELRQRADLAACFGQLARIYDRVWYGRATAGPIEAEQALSLCWSVINKEVLDRE